MPKIVQKPITAESLLDLEKRSLTEAMVSRGASRTAKRRKSKKTEEEIKAEIDAKEKAKIAKKKAKDFIKPEDVTPSVDITDARETGKDDVMNFLTNVFQPSIVKIEESLNKILGNFEEQIDADKEKQDQLRVDEDQASDKAREDKLEKPKEKGMFQTGIEKAIKPVQGFMDQILNFFKNILLGSAVMGLLEIIKDPEKIMKPIREFTNGIIDFVNDLMNGVFKFVISPINFILDGITAGIKFVVSTLAKVANLVPGVNLDIEGIEGFELPLIREAPQIPRIEPKAKAEMQGGGQVPDIRPAEQMQGGGEVPGQGAGDTVPAMLEPGEFVMSKGAVDQIGVGELEEMNAEGGGTNKPIIKEGTSYAKGGGSIGIKGSGNTGKMTMKNADGKQVGGSYNVVSGAPGTEGISQKMRKDMPGKGYPMPDGTYKVHSFDKHGPLGGSLTGLGDWSAYVGTGDGNIGKRSGMMIHSDIDPYGTLGCIGVALGGKPGTKAEKGFLKSWNKANPETISVDFGAPSGEGSGGGLRPETSDNSIAKMSSSKSGMTTPPGTPNGGGSKIMAMSGGKSGNSGGLTSSSGGNSKPAERFSSSDSRNDSNIIVQSIYNLVG